MLVSKAGNNPPGRVGTSGTHLETARALPKTILTALPGSLLSSLPRVGQTPPVHQGSACG